MERTQIYLTAREREALAAIAERTGRTQSDLNREAVDGFVARHSEENRVGRLRAARGIWSDREDLSDFAALRREFDERGASVAER